MQGRERVTHNAVIAHQAERISEGLACPHPRPAPTCPAQTQSNELLPRGRGNPLNVHCLRTSREDFSAGLTTKSPTRCESAKQRAPRPAGRESGINLASDCTPSPAGGGRPGWWRERQKPTIVQKHFFTFRQAQRIVLPPHPTPTLPRYAGERIISRLSAPGLPARGCHPTKSLAAGRARQESTQKTRLSSRASSTS